MRILGFLICLCTLTLLSCGTRNKLVYNYLEDLRDTTSKQAFYIAEPAIQRNDVLSIQVYSASLEPGIDQLYNQNQTAAINPQTAAYSGYLVDQRGNVEIPRIGLLHAEGLTKTQLSDSIKARLQGQLTNPSVIIRFLNFRIVVIGEVGSPGVKNINVENLNILEALALAGDITLYGKKREVKILRESNGTRQLGIIDVTSKQMFESPYYQLQQNDVILVEKTRYRVRSTEQSVVSQQLGFALSIITSIALLYNIFK